MTRAARCSRRAYDPGYPNLVAIAVVLTVIGLFWWHYTGFESDAAEGRLTKAIIEAVDQVAKDAVTSKEVDRIPGETGRRAGRHRNPGKPSEAVLGKVRCQMRFPAFPWIVIVIGLVGLLLALSSCSSTIPPSLLTCANGPIYRGQAVTVKSLMAFTDDV